MISIVLKVLNPSKMKRMQHPMARTVAKADKKQKKNERDRVETAEPCEGKETE